MESRPSCRKIDDDAPHRRDITKRLRRKMRGKRVLTSWEMSGPDCPGVATENRTVYSGASHVANDSHRIFRERVSIKVSLGVQCPSKSVDDLLFDECFITFVL